MHNKPHTPEAKSKMRQAKLGMHLSPATEFKRGKKNPYEEKRVVALARGEGHYKWQDKPTYNAIHHWINRIMGKPKLCSQCGFCSENGRQFHWANVSGKYLRNTSDWLRLCVRCHFKMDEHSSKIWRTRREQCSA